MLIQHSSQFSGHFLPTAESPTELFVAIGHAMLGAPFLYHNSVWGKAHI
jgi:hypothetical protein